MKDVERDEQQRQRFQNQLSSLTHKMEGLNMADVVGCGIDQCGRHR